ncbi:class 1 isoprenoid biosynthesis enzyme [Methanoplanus endosymbiosus]|uniref:Class 1 isoprenoid biosynthesis enzyme n=1 Tax=Methanoplanus endosymbiosus TaxID=33865 RepID=A0A9E7TKQ2_9EURY|nr:class 1 isoprenoid biosynthesis enzyme [Methanoplanus endosymbiosus]UUX92865.1 class 1 isoprenoid biosynthesis enzyme [Methanoplanus endosymbiosus]
MAVMIQAVLDNLNGYNEDESLYDVSHRYLLHDFDDLLNYGRTAYNPEIITKIIQSERRWLKKRYFIHNALKSTDKIFKTDTDSLIKYSEMYSEAINYYRYASVRDKGIIRQNKEIKAFKKDLKDKYFRFGNSGKISGNNELLDPEKLAEICCEMAGISVDDTALIKDEITEFIRNCPESYIKKGLSAKYIGSMFGVVKFGYDSKSSNLRQKIVLGSCYGITYLFDEIIDDPDYSSEEKEKYYRNISNILLSTRDDDIELSENYLMAYTENALIKMRDELPENRWKMLAKAYSAIADASLKGAEWGYGNILRDEDLYINSALKGAYTRIIPAILAEYRITEKFLVHTLRSGYIFQLPDDLRDFPEDTKNGNITAFNYYKFGANPLNHHPIEILMLAISRTSFIDYPELKDACNLYMASIFQSLKVLSEKNRTEDLCKLFSEMNIPDNETNRQLCLTGRNYNLVTDFETEIAGRCTKISLDMKKSLNDSDVR